MFDVLDRQTTLTGNQKKIIAAASSATRWNSSTTS